MRNLIPTFRSLLSLTVLAGIGLAGLLFPWTWAQVTAIVLVAVLVLIVVARNALRRASRRIDAILEEELGAEPDAEPAPVEHRLAS
jgi:membrane protein implicated in regulation of membrane protease activity